MISLAAEIRLAVRSLLRNGKRTAVAAITVGSGVAAFMLAGGFIAWIFQDMREATIHSQLGHLQIVRPGYFDKGIADPYAFLLPQDSALQNAPGSGFTITSLTPRLAFSGLIGFQEVSQPFIGEGVDPEKERPVSRRLSIISGADLAKDGDKSVLLGEGLAASLGAKVGDPIVLLVTAANGSANAVELTVVGTFATITKSYDDSALRIPISVARKLMRVSGATSWVMLLDRTENTPRAQAWLEKQLTKAEYEIVPWTAMADFYNKTVELFSKQVSVVKFIIAFIIVLSISNTQMMSVMERTTEIGTSLAIGLRRSVIMRLFLMEGILIGVVGGLLGILSGFLLAQLISAIGIPMPPPPGMSRGYIGQILVLPGLMLDAFVLAVSATAIASLAPAWKAGRMNIVDALRTNT